MYLGIVTSLTTFLIKIKAKVKTDYFLKIIQTKMAGGAIPLHTPLDMTLNFADLRSH